MKKKVIALVVDTELTNEQIEESLVHLVCYPRGTDFNDPKQRAAAASGELGAQHDARHVRVLDADETD